MDDPHTEETPAIAAQGLTKRFGDTLAVDSLDFRIPQGTVYGFLGPNGAGKTTTIEMLTTLSPPTSGAAQIMGHSIDDRESVKRKIGVLPHDPPVYESFTATEQLAYAADLRQMDADRADRRIEQLLERVDLQSDSHKRIGSFSEGMRRKVGLIQAILHDPPVVFLDEPTSGLDPRASRSVIELIHEQVDSGTTVFLSSHILPVVEALADTVGVLYRGKLVAEDDPARLVERTADGSTTLEEAFLSITTERGTV